jgi:DNA-binding XRE family transcriptional regulator
MIYFIRHTEYVKIGFTDDISTRLSDLQVSCPVKLEILGLIEGTLDDEKNHHRMFKHLWCNGEWFSYTEELSEFIQGLNKELLWKHGFGEHEGSVIGLIKGCRLKKNLTMDELGKLLGVSKQAVMDMEKREVQGRISIGSLEKALRSMGYRCQYRAFPV